MDLSRSTLQAMAGGIYRMLFPFGFHPPSLSLSVYPLFSRTYVSSHECTTLDDFRSRKEMLTVREKFCAVSWRQPNHKPSTTKITPYSLCKGGYVVAARR